MLCPQLLLGLLLLAPPGHGQEPAKAVAVQDLEVRVVRLEVLADVARPVLVVAVLIGLGSVAGVVWAFQTAKKQTEQRIAEAVGLKIEELHRMVAEADLVELVRRNRRILLVGRERSRDLEFRLRREGWRNVSTSPGLDEGPDAVELAHRMADNADLVVFDCLTQDQIIAFCARRDVGRERFAGLTRSHYAALPGDVRDALLFGNTPDQLLHWVEAALVRKERARRADDVGASVAS